MDTSRTQVKRRLDPENDRVQLDTLPPLALRTPLLQLQEEACFYRRRRTTWLG
jgi:hypothetical protein